MMLLLLLLLFVYAFSASIVMAQSGLCLTPSCVCLQGSQGPLSKKEELFYRQSQGRAHLFMDMRIVNDDGQQLPWDGKAAGELQVRGPHVLKAYFRVSHN